jgi:hypothetical protein
MPDVEPNIADTLHRHINAGTAPSPSPLGRMGYAPWMRFSAEELGLFDATKEVEIETLGHDRVVHRATIRVVVDEDRVLVGSYRGSDARSFREAIENPAVTVHVDGRRVSATAVATTDPHPLERTSAGSMRTHADDPPTPAILAPDNLDTTLRLTPA